MTDGPFRNAKLSSRWKRYGDDLVSDATSLDERTAQACDSMLDDINLTAISTLLGDIKAHAERPQMDLDPVSSIDALFDAHPRSSLTDALQKHVTANLREQMPIASALDQALLSTVSNWIGITKNRLDEECIRARDLGDMNEKAYRTGIERNRETFAAMAPDALRSALTSGNKCAFSPALQKKAGVDDGPEE